MVIINAKRVKLYTNIASAVLNMQKLTIIWYYTNVYVAIENTKTILVKT